MYHIQLMSFLHMPWKIFNNRIEISTYSNAWILAYITALLKEIKPKWPSDTIPQANLSQITKIFSEFISRQISHYIESSSFLYLRFSQPKELFIIQNQLFYILIALLGLNLTKKNCKSNLIWYFKGPWFYRSWDLVTKNQRNRFL